MSDTKPSIEQIIAAVDSLDNDAVDMLKRIVSIDSRLGCEADVQKFMYEEFKKISDPQLKVEIVPIIGEYIYNYLNNYLNIITKMYFRISFSNWTQRLYGPAIPLLIIYSRQGN